MWARWLLPGAALDHRPLTWPSRLQPHTPFSWLQVYQDAAEALDALASKLGSNTSGGDFLFGTQPSSLDALLYSCLAFLRAAPVVHPRLQQKLAGHRVLGTYVERLSQLAFSSTVPAAADAGLDWSQWDGRRGAADDK